MTEQMKEAIIKARKEVKEETDLKKRASLAKERLKMGYWTQLAVERADFLKREGDTGKSYENSDNSAFEIYSRKS